MQMARADSPAFMDMSPRVALPGPRPGKAQGPSVGLVRRLCRDRIDVDQQLPEPAQPPAEPAPEPERIGRVALFHAVEFRLAPGGVVDIGRKPEVAGHVAARMTLELHQRILREALRR